MDAFKSNVVESFKRARDDITRLQAKLDAAMHDNRLMAERLHEMSERLAVAEVKIRNLEKKR